MKNIISWISGVFVGKWSVLLWCALLCSCASTYRLNGHKVRVHDNSPRKYGFVLAIGFGLGEQFKRPSN